jgi:hypothetical protein
MCDPHKWFILSGIQEMCLLASNPLAKPGSDEIAFYPNRTLDANLSE